MSINTAMTAIADKIRGLLGLSGAMGLDAMASNLAVEQTNIADAYAVVSSKGGTVPESKVSGNLAAAIGTISTGGLDTSDATATANDIAQGKTAYVINGQKVTGNVPVQDAIEIDGATVETAGDKIRLSANFPNKKIMNSGAVVQLRTPKSNFGDAQASDVALGKTFTSAAGLKVIGTHECAAPSLQSKTVTPSESQQVVSPDSGYDGLSSVTVGAVSRTYVGSGVTKKSAATYTPGTSDQTITSGQYLSGKQTIKGDANLLAKNIKSGVSIFGVNGTFDGQTGTTQICEMHPIAIDNRKYNTTVPLLAGNAFLAEHCNDDGLLVAFVSLDNFSDVYDTIVAVFHGNRPIVSYGGKTGYGVYMCLYNGSYGTSWSNGSCMYPINNSENFLAARLTVNESGDLSLYLPDGKSLNAGSYLAVLVLAAAQ